MDRKNSKSLQQNFRSCSVIISPIKLDSRSCCDRCYMFLINTTPLRRTTSITQYSHLLFNRFALNHFKSGTREVHFIFDTPTKSFNPKIFEQSCRDAKSKSAHQHQEFTPNTPIPPHWREFIDCRQCKQSIIQSTGLAFLQTGNQLAKI